MTAPKMTDATLRVLEAFLQEPEAERYGLELLEEARLHSGTLYPILNRLERAGWLRGGWERIDESAEGRPRRRYYTMTPLGAKNGSAAFAERGREVRHRRRVQLGGAW